MEIQYGLITMYPPTCGHLQGGICKNRITPQNYKIHILTRICIRILTAVIRWWCNKCIVYAHHPL